MTNTDEIDILKRELKSDKITTRQKAFVKLSSVVTSHRKAINKIFENSDPDLSYDALFYAAHEGMLIAAIFLNEL